MLYLNENSGDLYSDYLQTEMITIHSHLENFEGVLMEWEDSIFTKLNNYNERGVVLFIGNLNVKICIFKNILFEDTGFGECYSFKL